MFALKKFISAWIMPLPFTFMLLVFGLGLLWFSRRHRLGKGLITLAALLLFSFSYSPWVEQAMVRLEREYPVYTPGEQPVDFIAVLGGYGKYDATISEPSRLGVTSLQRLVEGIRIHRLEPRATLIFSGYAPEGGDSIAQLNAAAAISLGIPQDQIIVESRPRDTWEEAEHLKDIVGQSPFVLVTSASHMKRAMAFFAAQGMEPIPAPTGHHVRGNIDDLPWFKAVLPSPGTLTQSRKLAHEYLGLIWSRLRYDL